MRGTLVGRAGDPEVSFLDIWRQRHILHTLLQTAGFFFSCDFSPRTGKEAWKVDEPPWRGDTRLVRGRKKGECLLRIPISWWVRGVGTSPPEAISLAISRSGVSDRKTLLPLLLYNKARSSSVFSSHDTYKVFPQLPKVSNHFLMCLWSPESQLCWKWAI